MSTITDVAKEADVSLATVSRVINKSFLVSDEKKERVLSAMEKLDYQVPVKAKEERNASPKLILVISTIYLPDLFSGLQAAASDLGYAVIYNQNSDNEDGWEMTGDILKILQNNLICGIIMVNAIYKNETLRNLLSPYHVVQIGEPLNMPQNYWVSIDDVDAAYDLTSHLISLGKKRIALMTIKHSSEKAAMAFVENRELGFEKALREHGIPFDESLKFYSDYAADGGAYAMNKLLARGETPDAMVCICDSIAYGALSVCEKNGLKVPEDIAICGFDNMEFSEFSSPPLTSIDQSFEDIGRESVHMLNSVINGETSRGRKLFVNHRLIVRKSTNPEA